MLDSEEEALKLKNRMNEAISKNDNPIPTPKIDKKIMKNIQTRKENPQSKQAYDAKMNEQKEQKK